MKKGKGDRVEEYRGITLMPSVYKVYAMVLVERLREEVERGGIIQIIRRASERGWGRWTMCMCSIT